MFAKWEAERAEESERGPHILVHTSLVLGRPTPYTHRTRPWMCPSLPPTSDDQVLQGSPSVGEVPLLACLLERGRDPILVGQDLAVLEGSRHYYDCGWGLGDGEPGGWALLKPDVPLPAFSSWLTAAPWWLHRDSGQDSGLKAGGRGCHLPEVTAQSQGENRWSCA